MRQIFKVNDNVVKKYIEAAKYILHKSVTSVAVHIRLGDVEFKTNTKRIKNTEYKTLALRRALVAINAAATFGCSSLKTKGKDDVDHEVVIVFVSDSLWLRDKVRTLQTKDLPESQGCQIKILSPRSTPQHINYLHGDNSHLINSYIITVGEWWLQGICNATIIQDEQSGYSRTAYGYSMQRGANKSASEYTSPGEAGLGEFGENYL
jgi:hypothetical protein